MTLVSPTQVALNDAITSASVNTPINQLATVINGGIDSTNVNTISGAKITSGTIPVAAMDSNANPETRLAETTFDYVASGCVISGDAYGSTLNWSMTSGVVYIGGKRIAVTAIAAANVVASKDTYVDISNAGAVTYTGGNSVTNNAASPSLAASSIRLGIIISGASSIASVAAVNQGQENKVLPIATGTPYAVTDSLGNLICPRDPSRKILGHRQITGDFSCTASTVTDITGLSVPVIAPSGRRIKVLVYLPSIFQADASGGADRGPSAYINEGATQLQQAMNFGSLNNSEHHPIYTYYLTTPTVGLHTYKARLGPGAFGTATLTAGATYPAYITVELA